MRRLKVKVRGGRLIDIDDQYKSKESYHRSLAKMPFETKIKELMQMWRIAEIVKGRNG